MTTILDYIKETGIFLICAQCIYYFVPEKKYGKYAKILIGILFIIRFLIPVQSLLNGDAKMDIEKTIESYTKNYQQEIQEGQALLQNETSDGNENALYQEIESEIKEKIEKTAENEGYQINRVEVDEDYTVNIYLSEMSINGTDGEKIAIPRVKIGEDKISDEEGMDENQRDLKARFLEILAMEEDGMRLHFQ